ncbi:alpha/beta fold hydrolase [Falsiroseomonas selenitidurans]|uniref:Alpha/beta hydrolase n=1 Tax=Falsiroseomonas selenitidurans TaxID=2716335 RepID=A0ABX1E9H0_9PROT|nr:alpha/beta hydrolase [Falsiroseomonas selenitidurans]NKC31570.1 alpha/beta hydrolase [Falsiroseomonas selenitidurans]
MIRTSDDVRLFHRALGAGPPVLFLASWSLPSDSWGQPMLAMAEAGLRAVAYDRRGHGRSDHPPGGYDYDRLADDLAEVMAALDLREVTLVAMSGAAGEAVRCLTRHGAARVARLALIGPTTPLLQQAPDNPDGIPAAALDALRAELRADFPAWLAANARPFGGPKPSEAMLDWIRGLALQASLPGLLAFHRALAGTDFRAELAALRLPVLVIQGSADETCPIDLTGRRSAALIPGARLQEYAGAPHGLIVSDPVRLATDLVAFARGA